MEFLLVLNRLAHDLGIAFGVGGATIAFIITKKAEKNPETAKTLMPLIQSISKLIWLGLILLIVSGIGLTLLVTWQMNKDILLIKHILVAAIFLNGIYIGITSRKLHEIRNKEAKKLRKRANFLITINLILWYVVTILSVIL